MRNSLLFAIALLALPIPAKADYFLWQDPGTGLTMSFPDTWKVQHNQKPDDILTVMGPSGDNGNPVCRVKVRDDQRYVIFPPRYGDDVQKTAVSVDFWERYVAEYDEYIISKVYDGVGLGRWFASYALASYSRHDGTVEEDRRAIMFASLYDETLYIVECSALAHAYENYRYAFQSIIKSVDFKKAYHELAIGEYANFLKGADHYFWAQTGPEGTPAY